MSEDKKDTLFFILFFIALVGAMILIVFIDSWKNGFKTDRQICEENDGVYIEDLSAHNQHQCMYGLKGEYDEKKTN